MFTKAFPQAASLLFHWCWAYPEPFGWGHPVSWPKQGLGLPHSGSHRKSLLLLQCVLLQKYPLCDLLTPLSPATSRSSCNHPMALHEWNMYSCRLSEAELLVSCLHLCWMKSTTNTKPGYCKYDVRDWYVPWHDSLDWVNGLQTLACPPYDMHPGHTANPIKQPWAKNSIVPTRTSVSQNWIFMSMIHTLHLGLKYMPSWRN